MKFYKRINILHCHINPPSFVVNELDAGVVEVPGVDGLEGQLNNGLDDVKLENSIVCKNYYFLEL